MLRNTLRYFLEIAYNGTAYHGWQVQDNAVSVQEKLNTALRTILREDIETTGAGRTDTGVHAKQLYVHFDMNNTESIDLLKLKKALNSLLPCDISVKRILPVPADAHARFDATSRSYEYHTHFEKNPFIDGFSWLLRDRPNIAKMNEAAKHLLGKQDFSCFSKSNTQVFTNICTIYKAEWQEKDGKLIFHITADRFLRNMVRAIVGTLMEIGLKGKSVDHIKDVITTGDRSKAGVSVPACGLFLTKITYPYIN